MYEADRLSAVGTWLNIRALVHLDRDGWFCRAYQRAKVRRLRLWGLAYSFVAI
jgi:hypothetical protein